MSVGLERAEARSFKAAVTGAGMAAGAVGWVLRPIVTVPGGALRVAEPNGKVAQAAPVRRIAMMSQGRFMRFSQWGMGVLLIRRDGLSGQVGASACR